MRIGLGVSVNGPNSTIAVAVVGGSGAVDPYADYYFYDTFTDSNGVSLATHVPEKGTWTLTGVLEVQSNKAKFLSVAPTRSFSFAIAPMTTANGYVQAELTKVGNGDYGVVANVQDVDHLWMAWHSLNTLYLYEQVSKEAFTSRGTYSTSTVGTLKIVTNGDTVEVWADGVLRITYTVSNRPYKSSAAGGLMIFGAVPSGSSFDNVRGGA